MITLLAGSLCLYFHGEALSFLREMGTFHGAVRQQYFCCFHLSFGGCQNISARNKLARYYQVVIQGYVRHCLLSENKHGSSLTKLFGSWSVRLEWEECLSGQEVATLGGTWQKSCGNSAAPCLMHSLQFYTDQLQLLMSCDSPSHYWHPSPQINAHFRVWFSKTLCFLTPWDCLTG